MTFKDPVEFGVCKMDQQSEIEHPMVSVIIPTFRRRSKLERCLESLLTSEYKSMEIIVINDSPDDDIQALKERFDIRLIQHEVSIYVVASRNEGARLAKGRILFFLDDDNIVNEKTVGLLVGKYSETTEIGVLGPLMFNLDGKVWFHGSRANWILPDPRPIPISQLNYELIETDVVPNAYMISKQLFFEVGMEDPDMFPTHEELDLVQRVKRYGLRSYIYSKATLKHDYGNLALHLRNPYRLYIIVKCNILIEAKYAPKSRLMLFKWIYVPCHALFYLFFFIPFKLDRSKLRAYYLNYMRGLFDGLKIAGRIRIND